MFLASVGIDTQVNLGSSGRWQWVGRGSPGAEEVSCSSVSEVYSHQNPCPWGKGDGQERRSLCREDCAVRAGTLAASESSGHLLSLAKSQPWICEAKRSSSLRPRGRVGASGGEPGGTCHPRLVKFSCRSEPPHQPPWSASYG